jgi:hypothetical protein
MARRRSSEDELKAIREMEIAFLRRFKMDSEKSLARLPKRSRSSSSPPGRR